MKLRLLASVAAAFSVLATSASAAFHVMQVEQIIAGVNGDNTAQAIQLRLRSAGQTQVSAASLWAADATGANRVLLLNIAGNVTNGSAGDRILITTASFNNAMILGGNAGFAGDFTLTTAIPASYLTAGKLTFEQDGGTVATPGTIYWGVAWGGASYTGTNPATDTTNDADKFFGDNLGHPGPLATALPTSGLQSELFTGTAIAPSTNNLADYALTANPVVVKNNHSSFNVVPEPATVGSFVFGTIGLASLIFSRRRRW